MLFAISNTTWLHLFSHYSRAKRNLKLASLATLLYPLSRKEVSHNLPVPKYSISWRKIWWIMFACAAALREGKRHVIQSWWMSAFVDKPVVCGDQVNKSLYLTLMRISIASSWLGFPPGCALFPRAIILKDYFDIRRWCSHILEQSR